MKKGLLIMITLVATIISFAQSKFDKAIAKYGYEIIDSNNYQKYFDPNAELKIIGITTNQCIGTQYMYKNALSFDSMYKSKIQFIPALSVLPSEVKDVEKVKNKWNYRGKVFLVNHNVHHQNRWDDRESGFNFRKSICVPCQADVIGTPYYIIFDKNNDIINYGYHSKKDFGKFVKEYFENRN